MQFNDSSSESATTPHVQKVNATPGGLVAATLGAAFVAGAILTFAWLPAEYGIDPTGVGHALGLTEMGLIKQQLHADADADASAAVAVATNQSVVPVAEINKKLDDIQLQLVAISAGIEANSQFANSATMGDSDSQLRVVSEADSQAASQADNSETAALWLDELEYTLMPTEGIEIKLVMEEGAIAEFEWTANGAVVNHDTHGDGDGRSISYEKGRSVPEQAGELTAAFTGNHGWYWRNRTDDDVVLTLRTRGDYSGVILPY